MGKNILDGAFDMHVHTSPDVAPRKTSDLEWARRILERGMAGGVIKNHYEDTAPRAALLGEQFPELKVAGGVVLNKSVGGLNPDAVERCAQMGGRLVWFPTMDSLSYQQRRHEGQEGGELDPSQYIRVLSEDGKLMPGAPEVLEVAASHNMLVGTGHISANEGMALVRLADELGCHMILTHADNPMDQYTLEQQQEAVRLGAIVEHCFFTTYYNRTPIEEIARQIRGVGCENVLLGTDFGQTKSPHSDEGLEVYMTQLSQQGFTPDELDLMFRRNPVFLFA